MWKRHAPDDFVEVITDAAGSKLGDTIVTIADKLRAEGEAKGQARGRAEATYAIAQKLLQKGYLRYKRLQVSTCPKLKNLSMPLAKTNSDPGSRASWQKRCL